MAYCFRRSILPSRLITCQVTLQKVALRNSNPFQSSLSKSYTNSTIHLSSHKIPSKESTSSPNLNNKIRKGFVNQLPTAIFVKLVMAGVVGLALVDFFYTGYQSKHNLNTVEIDTDDELTLRPNVVERLVKIFQPHKYQSSYHVICGDVGTGKTTLINIALRKLRQRL
ncbi:P-loop containing nucleoside triphosphate hydrolase protein [Rhizophagus clarus]|uniref:P-loop containing nucleoside triphosphate hydrolase protein n=1 Tax=Rhizophagus clarus TaxID=94130 RepID=A0A8H3M7S5_9GLOM|nr:P-loop containing nucleoside triphosphate hydrolase protein [Rhizophagus clarus]